MQSIEVHSKIATLKCIAARLGVEKIANHVLENPKFEIWSGSSKVSQHHYGKHGLLDHTYDVVNLCQMMSTYYLSRHKVNEVVVFLGALFHDFGKIYDYEPLDDEMTTWGSTDRKRLIHHVSRSSVEWTFACTNATDQWSSAEWKFACSKSEAPEKCTETLFESVLHVILCHHGQRLAGSPVAPKSREAWLVHQCDGISARMNDADTWDVVK